MAGIAIDSFKDTNRLRGRPQMQRQSNSEDQWKEQTTKHKKVLNVDKPNPFFNNRNLHAKNGTEYQKNETNKVFSVQLQPSSLPLTLTPKRKLANVDELQSKELPLQSCLPPLIGDTDNGSPKDKDGSPTPEILYESPSLLLSYNRQQRHKKIQNKGNYTTSSSRHFQLSRRKNNGIANSSADSKHSSSSTSSTSKFMMIPQTKLKGQSLRNPTEENMDDFKGKKIAKLQNSKKVAKSVVSIPFHIIVTEDLAKSAIENVLREPNCNLKSEPLKSTKEKVLPVLEVTNVDLTNEENKPLQNMNGSFHDQNQPEHDLQLSQKPIKDCLVEDLHLSEKRTTVSISVLCPISVEVQDSAFIPKEIPIETEGSTRLPKNIFTVIENTDKDIGTKSKGEPTVVLISDNEDESSEDEDILKLYVSDDDDYFDKRYAERFN